MLAAVNNIVSEVGANIEAQQLATTRDIGYLVMDVNRELSDEVHSPHLGAADERADAHPVLTHGRTSLEARDSGRAGHGRAGVRARSRRRPADVADLLRDESRMAAPAVASVAEPAHARRAAPGAALARRSTGIASP